MAQRTTFKNVIVTAYGTRVGYFPEYPRRKDGQPDARTKRGKAAWQHFKQVEHELRDEYLNSLK